MRSRTAALFEPGHDGSPIGSFGALRACLAPIPPASAGTVVNDDHAPGSRTTRRLVDDARRAAVSRLRGRPDSTWHLVNVRSARAGPGPGAPDRQLPRLAPGHHQELAGRTHGPRPPP